MEKKNKKEWLRAIKFTLISISAGLIELGTFELFDKAFKWDYWVCHLLSLSLSVLWNFTINRKYTFKSANNVAIAMLMVFGFYLVFTPVSTLLGNLASKNGANADIIKIVTLLCNFVLEFLYTRFVVYRNSCDTRKDEKNSKDSDASMLQSAEEKQEENAYDEEAVLKEDIQDK